MMLLVGMEMTKFVRDIHKNELLLTALTVGLSLVTNMAIGYVVAVILYNVLKKWRP